MNGHYGTSALWYKNGKFFEVKSTHVNFFLENPRKLGFSVKEKKTLCAQNGLEADTVCCPDPSPMRDAIVLEVLKRGAVRIRFYGAKTSVQCYDRGDKNCLAQLKKCVAKGMDNCFGNFLTVMDTRGWSLDLNNIGYGAQIDDFIAARA